MDRFSFIMKFTLSGRLPKADKAYANGFLISPAGFVSLPDIPPPSEANET